MPQTPASASPPIRTPFFPQIGTGTTGWPSWFAKLTWIFAYPWIAWFTYVGNQLNKASLNPPATGNSPGKAGTIATDGNFIYICVSANTWKRSPLTAF